MIKERVRVLKHSLEGWREILLPLNSLLIWDRPYDPGVLIGFITTLFAIFWYFDPSLLTTFSILGIVVCVVDYMVPALSSKVFSHNKWSGVNETKYEGICNGIDQTWEHAESFHARISSLKENKPKLYFVSVLFIWLLFAWVGSLVDNLLLTFMLCCILVLLPGFKHHGILEQCTSHILLFSPQAVGIYKTKNN